MDDCQMYLQYAFRDKNRYPTSKHGFLQLVYNEIRLPLKNRMPKIALPET